MGALRAYKTVEHPTLMAKLLIICELAPISRAENARVERRLMLFPDSHYTL